MVVASSQSPTLLRPATVGEAVSALAELGADGAVLAGGTWIMRAPQRGERLRRSYVSLAGLPGIDVVEVGDPTVVGANATHAVLAGLAHGNGPLGALAEAAESSAFVAVRNVATIAGNLFAEPFPEADLVPALLVSEASAQLCSPGGERNVPVSSLLASRALDPGEALLAVRIPCPDGRRSGYERLTVKAAGEYPVLGVALSVDLEGGRVQAARLAVASVESVARRLPDAEAALVGGRLEADSVDDAARVAAEELDPRDSHEAPGWYRLAVLPALLRRVATRLEG